ncbi:MAG: Sir2 family NAD-dependent protein deacetylase [Campylobacterota bacterium]|nr:Sir2 family NAD-dependent protein deacetylase [Campylobacterota bacterium]
MAKVVVLSGAGISAESGISTFRDSGGLWEEYDVDKICRAGCLVDNRDETIEFYDKRREDIKDKEPNKAHEVLAQLKNRYKDDIAIITQNVDNLFEKAGLAHEDVIHLHGYLTEVECEDCRLVYDIGYKKVQDSFNGKCPTCSSNKIRPFIVMFGEQAPMYKRLDEEMQDCELFVVIGTSGNVVSVDNFVVHMDKSILNNLEPSDAIFDELYTKVLYAKATEAIDEIRLDIQDHLKTKVDRLTHNLISATVHMRNYDLDGLTFEYEKDANFLHNYLVKIIKEVDDLSKDEFDAVITKLIVEFKDRRDNKLKKYETREDFNALICFFINDFEYEKIYTI